MRIHLIIIALLISAVSASSQNAHISIHVPGISSGHVAYQRLDKYSFVDSVALDGMGTATIDVECDEKYQFFRLILGQQKLPMILQKGENVAVTLHGYNILESEVSGSPETEYFLRLLQQYKDGGAQSCLKMIRKNPERVGNIFVAGMMDIKNDYAIIKSVADRFRHSHIPAAEYLNEQVSAADKKK